MNIVLVVLAAFAGVAATVSAAGKLRRIPQVVDTMHSVGVTDSQMPVLAVFELLGALGLLVGIWVPVLGTLAALGLTLYFAGALIAHLRAKHSLKDAGPALLLAVVSLVVLLLQLAR